MIIAIRARDRTWLWMSILVIPILPFLFLLYHAEPMERNRHALQILIELILAGWISIPMLLYRLQNFLEGWIRNNDRESNFISWLIKSLQNKFSDQNSNKLTR